MTTSETAPGELTDEEIGNALERTDATLDLYGLGIDAREAHYLWRQDQASVALARRMAKRMPNKAHAIQVVVTHVESARVSALLYASHLGAEIDRCTLALEPRNGIPPPTSVARVVLAKLRALNELTEEPLRYA